MDQQSPSPFDIYFFEIHASDFDPQIDGLIQQRRDQLKKDSKAKCSSFIDLTLLFVQHQTCFSFEKLGHAISLQETSTVATVSCDKSPLVHPICLCSNDL